MLSPMLHILDRYERRNLKFMPSITIYLVAYNEEFLLPFTLAFYRRRFPDAQFVILDNFSTDQTVNKAIELKCTVFQWWTNGKVDDVALMNLKNICWNEDYATIHFTEWAIVADMDELLDIWPEDLQKGNTILRSIHYEIVGDNSTPLYLINKAKRYPNSGKFICFNRYKIWEMNYGIGAHEASPIGEIKLSSKQYPLYHFKFLSVPYVMNRYKEAVPRMSKNNLKNKFSYHWLFSERKVRKHMKMLLRDSVTVNIK